VLNVKKSPTGTSTIPRQFYNRVLNQTISVCILSFVGFDDAVTDH